MSHFLTLQALILLQFHIMSFDQNNTIMKRNKRYVAFPDGASLSVALCFTQQVIVPIGSIFTEGVNWGIAYQLPNKTTYLENFNEKKHVIKRRDRGNLYGSIESVLENFGYNGRACIYRALCEAPSRLTYADKTVPEKIVEILFRYPLNPIEDGEPEEHRLYHWATRLGNAEVKGCSSLATKCPISLIDLALSLLDGQLSIR